MYILDYNENTTAQYINKQAEIHTTLSNRLYPMQYISPHDTARQYRTCIYHGFRYGVRSYLITIYASSTRYIITCIVHPGLVSCSFMQSLYPPI